MQCIMDVIYYFFDIQICSIMLVIWGYISIEINLRGSKVDIIYYEVSGEWEFFIYSILFFICVFGSNSLLQISF